MSGRFSAPMRQRWAPRSGLRRRATPESNLDQQSCLAGVGGHPELWPSEQPPATIGGLAVGQPAFSCELGDPLSGDAEDLGRLGVAGPRGMSSFQRWIASCSTAPRSIPLRWRLTASGARLCGRVGRPQRGCSRWSRPHRWARCPRRGSARWRLSTEATTADDGREDPNLAPVEEVRKEHLRRFVCGSGRTVVGLTSSGGDLHVLTVIGGGRTTSSVPLVTAGADVFAPVSSVVS